jgi:hypothetical protein
MVHTRDHASANDSGTLGQNRGNWCKRGGWQGVSDDRDFGRCEAGVSKTRGSGLRVAHDSVAPAKSESLRAELCRSHQIADLAMASNNDWNTGKFCGRNQREISVEIEGVRDLYLLLAQMTAQVESRT